MENNEFIRKVICKDVEVRDGLVRKGTSTGLVYLPVRLVGRRYSIILWDKEESNEITSEREQDTERKEPEQGIIPEISVSEA